METMEIQTQNRFLPLDLAIKYYRNWDCDIECKTENSIYYKYLSGEGTVEYVNGNFYQGIFRNGLMHGKGIYKWKNGLTYEGQFTNNNITGEGKLAWPDGSYYIGKVLSGKRQGFGQYYCSLDKSSYRGTWANGLKEGKGVLTFSNGAVYEGEFIKGLREGAGKMKYHSGNQFEGEWRGDKKEGQGTMNWFSALEKYEGQWKSDLPEGKGTYVWFEGKNESKAIKTIYKGEWKNGKRQGYGTFYYNSGCKMQGSFSKNSKEGLCFMMDQNGDCHIQYFKNDKSISKKQMLNLKQQKKLLLLPEITNMKKPSVLQNNDPAQNIYSKFIDIKSPLIDQSIYNLLLRQNSQLRSYYKTIIATVNKEIFNGLSIEGLWKLIKDMKVANEFICLAKLNRLFYKGQKSQFQIIMPNTAKLQLLKKNPNILTKFAYQNLQWQMFFDQIKSLKFDLSQPQKNAQPVNIEKISFNKSLDVHNGERIMLYRHFIVYLVHLAILQYNQTINSGKNITFRKCLEQLIVSIKNTFVTPPVSASIKTQKTCSEIITNFSHNLIRISIPQEYSVINRSLFDNINENKPQLLNIVDKTVTVKQVYCLLCRCGILKEPTQKMLFLQKIQRNMHVKASLLKKENKGNYASFQKIVLNSPHFTHIMNYQMINTEFDQILYILLNRKIGNAQSKQQFLKKYKETIKTMSNQLIKHRNETKSNKYCPKFRFNRISSKDKQREELIKRLQEERKKKIEEQRKLNQLRNEERQRKHMNRQDVDVKDYEQSEYSEQYYD